MDLLWSCLKLKLQSGSVGVLPPQRMPNPDPDAVFEELRRGTEQILVEDELKERLRGRMTESEESLNTRLNTSESEMEEADWFDHVVLNETGKLDETVFKIEEVISIERKVKSRNILDDRGDLID